MPFPQRFELRRRLTTADDPQTHAILIEVLDHDLKDPQAIARLLVCPRTLPFSRHAVVNVLAKRLALIEKRVIILDCRVFGPIELEVEPSVHDDPNGNIADGEVLSGYIGTC
jgi:hypothetical protein